MYPGKAAGAEKFPNGDKGRVFTVGHGGHPLNEEGMAGVEIDRIIGVLPPLGEHHAGPELFPVQPKILGNQERVADFLDHDDIGPETVDNHVLMLFAHLPQLQPEHHQTVFEFALAEPFPRLRVFIGADQVDIAPGSPGRRVLGNLDRKLEFGHETRCSS